MQKPTLPLGGNPATVQVFALAGRVFALGEIHRRQVSTGLIGSHAWPAEFLNQQTRDGERDIMNHFGVHTEASLMREQPVIWVALVRLRRARRTLSIGVTGDNGSDDVLDVPGM